MDTPLDVKKRSAGDIVIFEFQGELDETNADQTFTQIYNAIGDFSNVKLIFNFSGLKYLNSKSIGYIADIFSNVEENDGEMYLSNMTEEVHDTLELVGITEIIPVTPEEQEAIDNIG